MLCSITAFLAVTTMHYKSLIFSPGEKFKYCNSNYILLGYIIELVSGEKYRDFIQNNIFIPLKMNDSGYDDNISKFDNKAVGYKPPISNPQKADYPDMSIPYSAGGLCSTFDDLYKWDQALYTNKIINDKSLKKMFTPFSDSDKENYGYGWWLNSSKNIMFHRGYIHGFSAYIYRNTKKHIIVIILSNIENQDLDTILDKMLLFIF